MERALDTGWSQGKTPVFLMFDDEKNSIDHEADLIEGLGIQVQYCDDVAEFIAAIESYTDESSELVLVGISIDNRMPDIKTVKFPKTRAKRVNDTNNSGIVILTEFLEYAYREKFILKAPLVILTGNPVNYEFEDVSIDNGGFNVHFCKKNISIVDKLDVPRGYLSSFEAIINEIVKEITDKVSNKSNDGGDSLRARFDAADIVKQEFDLSDIELAAVMGLAGSYDVDFDRVKAGEIEFPNRDWTDRIDMLFDLALFLDGVEFQEGLNNRSWMRECVPIQADGRTLFSIASKGTASELRRAVQVLINTDLADFAPT